MKTSQMRMLIEAVLPELVAVSGHDRARAIGRETAERMGAGGIVPDWIRTMAAIVEEGGNAAEEAAFLRGLDQFKSRLRPN